MKFEIFFRLVDDHHHIISLLENYCLLTSSFTVCIIVVNIMKVNYMAPEAIAPYCMDPGSDSRPGDRGGGDRDGEGDDHEGMSMRLGRASDIWSLGCILYQMIYGRPPFAALTTIQKLRAIPDDKYVIQYPQESEYSVDWDAVGTIQACLQRDPRKRALIKGENGLLSMPFLSIDAMQHSRNRNKDKCEKIDESRSQDILQDKNNDNCISVSKDKVCEF
jgi:serine/threonine protein kinase